MTRKEHCIIIALLIVIVIFSILIVKVSVVNDDPSTNLTSSLSRELIANDTVGSVEVIRNIGNPNGSKIAYVVGVHPLENLTHRTLVNQLCNASNLDHCYDIYIINVTRDVGHYGDGASDNSPGRQNGQNLALEYVYPKIVNGSYELAIDVHSNVGAYPYQTFVFSPLKEGPASEISEDVASQCENISYYSPPSTTSGPYLTIPLNENGIPAFYYEEYSFALQDVKDMHMRELIDAVDNLGI